MRETCRVRSRSTSAAGAVHVRVRTIARRSSADSGTSAAAALARQSADSSGVRRTATMTGRRLALAMCRHGGKGGDTHVHAIHRSAGPLGIEGAKPLGSPAVIPGVSCLGTLSVPDSPRATVLDGLRRRESRVGGISIPIHGEARPKRCQPRESRRFPKGSSAVPGPDRPPATAPPSPPEESKTRALNRRPVEVAVESGLGPDPPQQAVRRGAGLTVDMQVHACVL